MPAFEETTSRTAVITNEQQYRIAKSQARKFEQAIAAARETETTPEVDPRVRSAMTEALESELAILREQVYHYEAFKRPKA
jgi:hypothetical protein